MAKGANASLCVRNKPGRWGKRVTVAGTVIGEVAGTGLQARDVGLDFIMNLKDSFYYESGKLLPEGLCGQFTFRKITPHGQGIKSRIPGKK